jgi:hypothetical protein
MVNRVIILDSGSLGSGDIISMFFAIACNARKLIFGQSYPLADDRYAMRENR